MIALIISGILSFSIALFHVGIERFFFGMGASWTFSKAFPYVLCLTAGAFFLYAALKFFKKKSMAILIGSGVLLGSFGLDFALKPIYEGDFSNTKKEITSTNVQIAPNALTVIAIPGCPFCHESVEVLKVLQKRNPKLTINYLVASADEEALINYRQQISGAYPLALFSDLDALNELQVTSFPTFIFTSKSGDKFLWTNDTFGAPAKDFIEKSVK